MIPSPAAATVDHQSAPVGLRERLEDLVERSSRGEGQGLVERLLPATPLDATAGRDTEGFSWLVVPGLLARQFGMTASAPGRELLADLCWLQYCVYGVFRVQDDLVDGDSSDPRLAVQTNHLMVEAARCAARHFDGASTFWTVFHETIDATSSALLRLDRVQRSPDRRSDEELRLYSELSACLKIATAGVALAADREDQWWRQLSPALDSLAVAGQIVDDLRDIRDDLAEGRVNYAAWFLSHPILGATPEAVEAVVASNLATTDRLERLLDRAGQEMDRGLATLEPALCPELHRYLHDYREGLVGLGARILSSKRAALGYSTRNL